jgi:hypothetical protein
MALTAAETRRLQEVLAEIAQIEQRLAVSHGLGDSHSSQGISATFNENQKWRGQLSILRRLRDQLEAKDAGEPIPPAPGVTVSIYRPVQAYGEYGY